MPHMKVTLKFDEPGYVGEPYWPEMAKLIDIRKRSGVDRMKSDATRAKALQQYLDANDMTQADYDELERLANRPFHTNGDDEIVIPGDRFLSCLVHAAYEAKAAVKICKPEVLRASIKSTEFRTGKNEPDGTWERFAVHESTNQRGLRSSEYIENFEATGTITFDAELCSPKAMTQFLAFAGKEVGIGSSRKMGWGRFTISVERA